MKTKVLMIITMLIGTVSQAQVTLQKAPVKLQAFHSDVRAFVAPNQGPRALFVSGDTAEHAAKLLNIEYNEADESIVMSGPEVFEELERLANRGKVGSGWTHTEELEALFIDLLHQQAQENKPVDASQKRANAQNLDLIVTAAAFGG